MSRKHRRGPRPSRKIPGGRPGDERLNKGLRAERRGRRVGREIADFERLAMHGEKALVEALISRQNQRMDRCGQLSGEFVDSHRKAIAMASALHLSLAKLGASQDRGPAIFLGEWIDHLAWGIDSVFAASRLLFCGQIAGAAIIARSQLERWTANLAYNLDETRRVGESRERYIARLWTGEHRVRVDSSQPFRPIPGVPIIHLYPDRGAGQALDSNDTDDEDPSGDHFIETPVMFGGQAIVPGNVFVDLSELLHGRKWEAATRWEAWDLLNEDTMPNEVDEAYAAVSDALSLVLRRIKGCLATVYAERNDEYRSQLTFGIPERLPSGDRSPPNYSLWPLDPATGAAPRNLALLQGPADAFAAVVLGKRPAKRLFRDDEMLDLGFLWVRYRAVKYARIHLDLERQLLGLTPQNFHLGDQTQALVLTAELAALLGEWTDDDSIRTAAQLAASALRSAIWLWLEDDNRSMACLRTVLEQTARLRVWRLKPERAQRREDSSKTTPKDWLSDAGWRRLSALNRALGELTHFQDEPRWEGAMLLLADLDTSPSDIPQLGTARRNALHLTGSLLTREITQSLNKYSEPLSRKTTDLFNGWNLIGPRRDKEMARWLENSWSLRNQDLADYYEPDGNADS